VLRSSLIMLAICCSSLTFAEELDYQVTDPELKVVRLDSSQDDSFLSVRLDSEGRIFVGGRKTLFVYDLDEAGAYRPRRLLFEFPDHTWVNDIEVRGDDLYVVTVSAVYRLPGARIKREDLTIERLLWGVPNGHVHQCFHACAWGPDGDLYVSMGDPLWYYGDFNRPDHWGHWTMFYRQSKDVTQFPENRAGKQWASMPYNGVGAVFRIHPDGTGLQSVSRGLRNSCGLCFDKHWNLFTNDNDHEGLPSLYAPGRLLHVTPHSYFSWPRGWLQSKTPDRADLLPAVNDQMGRAVPVLQTYYADGYLPEKYDNSLMVARWCRRQVTYFPLQPKGSTFTGTEHVLLEGRDEARPVGVCVGRGGRVFVTICYMAQNEGSPTYRSDLAVITRKDDPTTMPFDACDATTAKDDRLWKELQHPALSRRNAAHQGIIARGGDISTAAAKRLSEVQDGDNSVATPHLIWLAASQRNRNSTPAITAALKSVNPILRTLAIRAVTEYGDWRGQNVHTDPQSDSRAVKLALLNWHKSDPDADRDLLTAASDADGMLRLTATTILAQRSTPQKLLQQSRSTDTAHRLAAVVATGFRLTIPPVDAKIPDDAPLAPQQKEEANIIQYADAREPIDLRTLGRVGNFTVAEHWKAMKHTDEQEQLFAILLERLEDDDDKIRLQAAHFLSLLNDPRSEPKIVAVTTDVQDRRLNLGKLEHLKPIVWTLGPVPDTDGFKTIHPVETSAIDLAGKYEIGGKHFEWTQTKTTSPDRPLYDFRTLFGLSPNSSVYSHFRFDAPTAQRMQLLIGSEDGVKVWQNGKLVFENDVVRPLIQLDDVVSIDLQPGSNDILVRVRMRKGSGGQYFHFRHLGEVKLTIPDKPDGLSLAERLKSAGNGSQPIDPRFLEVDWVEHVKTGDVARGKKLFAAESLGCAKCHAATSSQTGGGGPSLADAGKRFTIPYLVESVLAPSKVISPVFKSTIIETADGKVITGLVVLETAEKLEVLQPDTKRISIVKSQIEARKSADVSAMPQGIVKTPEELRDVIRYLMSNPQD